MKIRYEWYEIVNESLRKVMDYNLCYGYETEEAAIKAFEEYRFDRYHELVLVKVYLRE